MPVFWQCQQRLPRHPQVSSHLHQRTVPPIHCSAVLRSGVHTQILKPFAKQNRWIGAGYLYMQTRGGGGGGSADANRQNLGASGNCSCADYLYCRLAVVTAFSDDFFNGLDMIRSAQKHAPNVPIFVYDLGLTQPQRQELRQHCNVEVRRFAFERSPFYFQNLSHNEAWSRSL